MPNRIRHEFIIAISPPFTSLHPEGDSAVPMCFVSDAPARVDLLIAISSAEALLPDSIAARAKLRVRIDLMTSNSCKDRAVWLCVSRFEAYFISLTQAPFPPSDRPAKCMV